MKSNPKSSQTPDAPLLFTRQQVARMLGNVDISFVRRLEKAGRLQPIRLTRSPSAMAFYRARDVMALVEEASDER